MSLKSELTLYEMLKRLKFPSCKRAVRCEPRNPKPTFQNSSLVPILHQYIPLPRRLILYRFRKRLSNLKHLRPRCVSCRFLIYLISGTEAMALPSNSDADFFGVKGGDDCDSVVDEACCIDVFTFAECDDFS